MVYSGDTRPCDALVAAGRGATLLIHEATFDDDLADDARAKRHSTRSEALDVAARMGAYRTLLTHLSQRYARDTLPFPSLACEEGLDVECSQPRPVGTAVPTCRGTSLVAFDMMAINLADLADMPSHMDSLTRYFGCEQRMQAAQRQADLAVQIARSERLERELEISGLVHRATDHES